MSSSIILNNGNEFPLLGVGLSNITDMDLMKQTVTSAVNSGYRLFDTASAYKNEDLLGNCLEKLDIPREELFITTKIWNNAQTVGDIEGAFKRSLERLKLDYVDMYMIHWEVPGCTFNTWREMEKLYHQGLIKNLGVSNFDDFQLDELLRYCDVAPAVNQIEIHPLLNNNSMIKYCKQNGIAVQAHSPFANKKYFTLPDMVSVADKYNKTPAQIALRWIIQKGVSAVFGATRADHMVSNGRIFDFELSEEDMLFIDALDNSYRIWESPEL